MKSKILKMQTQSRLIGVLSFLHAEKVHAFTKTFIITLCLCPEKIYILIYSRFFLQLPIYQQISKYFLAVYLKRDLKQTEHLMKI